MCQKNSSKTRGPELKISLFDRTLEWSPGAATKIFLADGKIIVPADHSNLPN